ncbi:MAG: HAD-IA family hydrolase [Calditrichaeota bacterium]|nr:HAD-IA family hydrolase [Calditrichota bacterium]
MNEYRANVLITDLDNTLFNWFDVWYRSFSVMLDIVLRKSRVDRDTLLAEMKVVHQKHGTSEYAFLLEELPSLEHLYGAENIKTEMSDAIEAYRAARKEALMLYPTVYDALVTTKNTGTILVGYTESLSFYSRYRIVNLGLDGLLDYLFSPPDHALPAGREPDKTHRLQETRHMHTPDGEVKPNPHILMEIVDEIGEKVENCVYVGDSLHKDMAMANSADMTTAWAKYGVAHHGREYELLRDVTHWTPAEVELEKIFEEDDVEIVLDKNFGQILNFVQFGSMEK